MGTERFEDMPGFELVSSVEVRGFTSINDYRASTREARVRLYDLRGILVHAEIATGVDRSCAEAKR